MQKIDLRTRTLDAEYIQSSTQSKRQKTSSPPFAEERIHDVVITLLLPYLTLKSILDWGLVDKKWKMRILENKKDFFHVKNASFWLAACVQRILYFPENEDANLQTLEKLVGIERDFSAQVFPSACISSFRLHSDQLTNTPECQKLIEKIPELKGGLQKLYLYGDNITKKHLSLANRFPRLKKLGLDNCSQIRRYLNLIKNVNIRTVCFNLAINNIDLNGLSGLVSLDSLTFYNHHNVGAFPARINTKLRKLKCVFSYFSDAGLANLKNCPVLQVLNISSSSITNEKLFYLKDLTGLTDLILDSNQITDVGLFYLRNLISLQTLSLHWGNFTANGLAYLQHFTALHTLNLSSCKITDSVLSHLSNFSTIHTLNLMRCQITDLDHLSNFSVLHILNLACCRNITDAALYHLRNLSMLQTLILSECPITGSGLSDLSPIALDTLDLSGTPVNDEGLGRLKHLTALRKLTLDSCKQISDGGLLHLQSCKDLRILELDSCNISDIGLVHLQDLPIEIYMG